MREKSSNMTYDLLMRSLRVLGYVSGGLATLGNLACLALVIKGPAPGLGGALGAVLLVLIEMVGMGLILVSGAFLRLTGRSGKFFKIFAFNAVVSALTGVSLVTSYRIEPSAGNVALFIVIPPLVSALSALVNRPSRE